MTKAFATVCTCDGATSDGDGPWVELVPKTAVVPWVFEDDDSMEGDASWDIITAYREAYGAVSTLRCVMYSALLVLRAA